MLGKNNDLLVPALIGLGIFAQNSEMNLANNTSILLILFLLLEKCGKKEHHHDGYYGRYPYDGIVALRSGEYIPAPGAAACCGSCNTCGNRYQPRITCGCPCNCDCHPRRDGRHGHDGRHDGCGCDHHHDHHRHRPKVEHFAHEVAEAVEKRLRPFEKHVEEKLEKIKRCACHTGF